MFAFLFILFRVIVIVCVTGALLTIRKTRLRHIPARQTRVSRHDRESTRWLNGLVDSIQDCAACIVRDTANKYASTVNTDKDIKDSTLTMENVAKVRKQIELASDIEQSNWLFSCLLLWKRPFHSRRAREEYMEFYKLNDLSFEQNELQEMKLWVQNICIALYEMFMCAFTALVHYLVHIVHASSGREKNSSNENISEQNKVLSAQSEVAKNNNDDDVNHVKQEQSSVVKENEVEETSEVSKHNKTEKSKQEQLEYEEEWYQSNKLIALVQERVNATLEDRGIAAWSDFRIHSLGNTPPRVQILSIKPKTTSEAHTLSLTHTREQPTEQVIFNNVNTIDKKERDIDLTTSHIRSKTKPSTTTELPSEITSITTTTNASSCDNNNHSSNNAEVKQNLDANNYSPIDTVNNKKNCFMAPFELECEAEVEYSGNLDISLRAEVCLWRGRRLPLEVRMGAVRLIRCHIFAELQMLIRTPECIDINDDHSGNTVMLSGKVWLESNPLFDLQMHTKFSRLGITNCFLIPLIVKYGFLYFVRKNLRRSDNAKGISFTIPLQK